MLGGQPARGLQPGTLVAGGDRQPSQHGVAQRVAGSLQLQWAEQGPAASQVTALAQQVDLAQRVVVLQIVQLLALDPAQRAGGEVLQHVGAFDVLRGLEQQTGVLQQIGSARLAVVRQQVAQQAQAAVRRAGIDIDLGQHAQQVAVAGGQRLGLVEQGQRLGLAALARQAGRQSGLVLQPAAPLQRGDLGVAVLGRDAVQRGQRRTPLASAGGEPGTGMQRDRVVGLAAEQAVDQATGLAVAALRVIEVGQLPEDPGVVAVLGHRLFERELGQRGVAATQRGLGQATGQRGAQAVHLVDAADLGRR